MTTTQVSPLLYQYEAAVLEFFNTCFPEIKTAALITSADVTPAMTQVLKYPYLVITRDIPQWKFYPVWRPRLDATYSKYSPIDVVYSARIYFQSQVDIISAASQLKFYWNKDSYIMVPLGSDESVRVALRLVNMTLGEERPSNDLRGAKRYIEVSWQSSLFWYETKAAKLVKEVRVYTTIKGSDYKLTHISGTDFLELL